jgi:hypothetical protein
MRRFRTPFPLLFLEFNPFPGMERAEPIPEDLTVMHEEVVPVFASDEAVAFAIVEPLDRAHGHRRFLLTDRA